MDSEGYVACDPIVGMDPEGYEKQMKQLLEAYEKAEKAAAATADAKEKTGTRNTIVSMRTTVFRPAAARKIRTVRELSINRNRFRLWKNRSKRSFCLTASR